MQPAIRGFPRLAALSVLGLAGTLAGCGQRGALFLPETAVAAPQPTTEPGTDEAEQRGDDER
jgi:predicted small lipoprotein YifL